VASVYNQQHLVQLELQELQELVVLRELWAQPQHLPLQGLQAQAHLAPW
jgi:hypothetical protein